MGHCGDAVVELISITAYSACAQNVPAHLTVGLHSENQRILDLGVLPPPSDSWAIQIL